MISMKKKKTLVIFVICLITTLGVSFAYFVATAIFSGEGASTSRITATIQGSILNVEGTLEFNDLNIYLGHEKCIKC